MSIPGRLERDMTQAVTARNVERHAVVLTMRADTAQRRGKPRRAAARIELDVLFPVGRSDGKTVKGLVLARLSDGMGRFDRTALSVARGLYPV